MELFHFIGRNSKFSGRKTEYGILLNVSRDVADYFPA